MSHSHRHAHQERHPRRTERSDNNIRIVFTENGRMRDDLLDKQAREAAKRVADDGKNHANKPTQLRRFYDELVMWDEKTRQNPERFEDYKPLIRMLKARAAYAEGRRHTTRIFTRMLDQMIDSIDSPEALHTAKLFFEALMRF